MEKHEKTSHHQDSIAALTGSHSADAVDNMLDKNIKQSKADNFDMLSYVIDSLLFLCRQGQAIRGSYVDSDEACCEPNSNMWQSLKLQAKRSERVHDLMSRRLNYCSSHVQNELIGLMGNSVLRQLAEEIRTTKFYTVMVDETPDTSSNEQAVICFRY